MRGYCDEIKCEVVYLEVSVGGILPRPPPAPLAEFGTGAGSPAGVTEGW